jgi:hypothetical protein
MPESINTAHSGWRLTRLCTRLSGRSRDPRHPFVLQIGVGPGQVDRGPRSGRHRWCSPGPDVPTAQRATAALAFEGAIVVPSAA